MSINIVEFSFSWGRLRVCSSRHANQFSDFLRLVN
jgi:hypothetical protein